MRLEVILMIHDNKTQRKITVENTKLRRTKWGTSEKESFDVLWSVL